MIWIMGKYLLEEQAMNVAPRAHECRFREGSSNYPRQNPITVEEMHQRTVH